MATKKKVVKKVVKKAPERIQNINLVKYFKTGKKQHLDECVYIEGNILYCAIDNPRKGDVMAAAIKVDEYTIINGDDVVDDIGDFDDVIEDMQDHGDNEITTSFVCLKNAGINLHKIKVLEIQKDLDVLTNIGDKDFNGFESTVPQGATYTEYNNSSDYESTVPQGATYTEYNNSSDYDEEETSEIIRKRYHRAGCMLIRAGKHSYICGMDEESYFVTKLPKNTTTIEKAFQSLKPKAVQQWEKKNKTQAERQGEWFFLPTTLKKVKGMRRKGLPLWKDGGNKHVAYRYVVADGKNYVKGNITHVDHATICLGNIIHEAHMNTALGSWSEQGVD